DLLNPPVSFLLQSLDYFLRQVEHGRHIGKLMARHVQILFHRPIGFRRDAYTWECLFCGSLAAARCKDHWTFAAQSTWTNEIERSRSSSVKPRTISTYFHALGRAAGF